MIRKKNEAKDKINYDGIDLFPPSQNTIRFGFSRYMPFAMHLEKLK